MFRMTAKTSASLAAAAMGLMAAMPASAQDIGHMDGVKARPELDAKIASTLQQCAQVAPSCGDTTANAAGVLVFPSVLTVDLGVGGSGGSGALVENGKIVGYYDVGEASAGAQLGIKEASQVYVVRDQDTLAKLTDNGKWEVGAAADLTVAKANVSASAQSGDPLVYIFDADGLNAGVNVSALKIWKDNDAS